LRGKAFSKVTKAIRLIFSIVLFLALFFVPAGTLKWTEAWILIIFYMASVFGVVLWLKKNDPGLLKERSQRKKNVKVWDRIFILVYVFFLLIMLCITGLDAVRFQWSFVPVFLKIIGFLGFIPGFILGFWAMRENTFLSDRVRIQVDRGHKVCSTGPYKYVRHPMYVGVIIVMLSFPFALGSLFAVIPAIIIVKLFIIRTALEDRTLQDELPRYKEYTEAVRFRLLPGVW
jgi:protein-S-isoprenylcysteine O-methyltransferase Ste14